MLNHQTGLVAYSTSCTKSTYFKAEFYNATCIIHQLLFLRSQQHILSNWVLLWSKSLMFYGTLLFKTFKNFIRPIIKAAIIVIFITTTCRWQCVNVALWKRLLIAMNLRRVITRVLQHLLASLSSFSSLARSFTVLVHSCCSHSVVSVATGRCFQWKSSKNPIMHYPAP